MNNQITPQDLNLPEYKGFVQDVKLKKGGKKSVQNQPKQPHNTGH